VVIGIEVLLLELLELLYSLLEVEARKLLLDVLLELLEVLLSILLLELLEVLLSILLLVLLLLLSVLLLELLEVLELLELGPASGSTSAKRTSISPWVKRPL
jgi:hypothetical protein